MDDPVILPRVEKLEVKTEQHEKRLDSAESRLGDTESQVGRITSHIESEVGLARKDVSRIEKRLFGDEDDEYGGRFGQLLKRLYRIEVWFLAFIAAAGIVGFMLVIYQVISRSK